jgi:predicted GIY-YIG superfamily endonuclease
MAQQTILWPGKSGEKYRYWISPLGAPMKQEPGNYVFARETENGSFVPIYIGQTSDLSERFDDHHKMPCIRQHKATHMHTHTSSASEKGRKAEEADLIERWNPACND